LLKHLISAAARSRLTTSGFTEDSSNRIGKITPNGHHGVSDSIKPIRTASRRPRTATNEPDQFLNETVAGKGVAACFGQAQHLRRRKELTEAFDWLARYVGAVMSFRSFFFSGLALSLALAGCSGTRNIPQTGGIILDTPKSASPGSILPAPMVHTAILPASMMAVKPQSAIQGASWTQIPGAASYAAAAPDGSLWVLSTAPAGPDKYIWHYVGGTWTNISGLATRLSVAPSGTLYAINSGGGAYSYSGGTWTAFGGGCRDLTAAADGSLYVISNAGGADGAIWHYATGTWTQQPGSGNRLAASWDPGTYANPGGTITPKGLYVINSLGSIYYLGTAGYVQLPGAGSAVAPMNGGLFVLGAPADPSGNVLYYYNLSKPGWSAQSGAGVSISTNGTSLYAISASGSIYTTPITTIHTIVEFALPSANAGPFGIASGSDGNLWVTERGVNKIGRMTPSGMATEYSLPTPNAQPQAITAGLDGNLWFVEYAVSKIGKITTAGTVTEYAMPHANDYPTGIAWGPDGNLWITEVNGADTPVGGVIQKMTPSGGFTQYQVTVDPAVTSTNAITAGPDGKLWFTILNTVKKITTSGVVTAYPLPSGTSSAGVITTGPDGNLWFAESNPTGIAKITTAGTITEYALPAADQLVGIVTGPDGNIWYADVQGHIGRVTTDGQITEYGVPAGTMFMPNGITTGADGNIWFTDLAIAKVGNILP